MTVYLEIYGYNENFTLYLRMTQEHGHQAPARAGADPKKNLGSASDLYMQQQRGCFSAVIFKSFQPFESYQTSYPAISRPYKKSCRRPHVEIRLRKKVIPCRNPQCRPVMRVLSACLPAFLMLPGGIVPPTFRPLSFVRS